MVLSWPYISSSSSPETIEIYLVTENECSSIDQALLAYWLLCEHNIAVLPK